MPPFDTADGLLVTQEGTSARARRGELNFLFVDRSTDIVVEEYGECVDRVRASLAARRRRLSSDEMNDEEFADLTQEIALHWMYFYVINRMPVEVSEADMDHPQSWHIIWSFYCRKFGDESPDVLRLASAFSNVSQTVFERWLEGKKLQMDK